MRPLRRIVWLCVALGLLSQSSVVAQDTAVKLPEPAKVHLYLLIGQSNMAGRGKVEAIDQQPHPRVLKFTKELTWAPAVDPLHFDKPTIVGVGLGSAFGRAMADANPDVVIGLIPCAVGGTPLSRWQPGADLYEAAQKRLQAALPSGTLKGVLWHQGENDASAEDTANNYAERLGVMVRGLRKSADNESLPFVAGELGLFLKRQDKNGKPNYWPVINEQLHRAASELPSFAVVSAQDLTANADQVHFDSRSLREFGQRYAKAMQQLQASSKSR